MARLMITGNSKIQQRQSQWGFIDNEQIPVQKEKILAIFVDDILTDQKITPLHIEINLKQLIKYKIDTLIKMELNEFLKERNLLNKTIFFYDIYGNQIKYYSKSSKSYLFSTRSNLFWLFVRPFDHYIKQINKIDRGASQSYHSNEGLQQIPVCKLKSCLSLISVHQDVPKSPPTTHRGTFLTKEMRNLQSVYDNYTRTTSVQSSRPFLSPKTQKSSFIFTSKIKMNKQEKYFIENMEKCQEELQNYIENMHNQLSQKTDDVKKIIKFYDQIQYPTPKSRAFESKTLSKRISHPLQLILDKEQQKNKFKPRNYFSDEQNWLESIPLLTEMNIPDIQAKYKLNRAQLYAFYSFFKVLQLLTAITQKREKNKLTKGISYDFYRQGIENIQDQSEYMAKGIFNIIDSRCSGFLDWQQFLFLMSSVQAKTKEERIDLFIKIADMDRNGKLSYPEVSKLSHQTMSKIVKTQDTNFLNDISEFFTRVIFDSVNISYDKEIDFHSLKDIITKGHPNSDLLCLFCGAEF
ncbi:unnamed protein product (macronuclear) [Paramecium tetraurelia]|uniref:EF-hand domain-containing protein n=1 Tax=Paramecium tetraurelia TaxID=5888 RepID=A0CEB8_PARTE|nr:uncharacterized protein GSPATT00037571001 [Paramecium tetraurelia]CAK69135.1 unnamed protein product [Paramecium tetraurelia]|eukprot:XP_001436532.1 hypothetical protein (macronuclear) [Paramecium tetraurelia strain d4-2]